MAISSGVSTTTPPAPSSAPTRPRSLSCNAGAADLEVSAGQCGSAVGEPRRIWVTSEKRVARQFTRDASPGHHDHGLHPRVTGEITRADPNGFWSKPDAPSDRSRLIPAPISAGKAEISGPDKFLVNRDERLNRRPQAIASSNTVASVPGDIAIAGRISASVRRLGRSRFFRFLPRRRIVISRRRSATLSVLFVCRDICRNSGASAQVIGWKPGRSQTRSASSIPVRDLERIVGIDHVSARTRQ